MTRERDAYETSYIRMRRMPAGADDSGDFPANARILAFLPYDPEEIEGETLEQGVAKVLALSKYMTYLCALATLHSTHVIRRG